MARGRAGNTDLHGHEQIEATFWRPIGKHGVVIMALGVNALGLLDHRRRTVDTFGMRTEGHRVQLTDDPAVAAAHVDGPKLRPSSAVRVRPKASISPTAGAWPRSIPSSRPSSAQSLNTSTAGRTSVMAWLRAASHHLGGAKHHHAPTACRGMADLDDVLYPTIEPHDEGMLEVTDLHTVAWKSPATPRGRRCSSSMVALAAAANPTTAATSIQTTGASFSSISAAAAARRRAELEDNTTMASVSDIERLREHLGIEAWVVFGGSWGSSLSLIYAQHHPERVQHLVLRGIFLCRDSEFAWSTKRARATSSPTFSRVTATTSQKPNEAT